MARAPRCLTEQQFMQQVVDLARLGGWRVYHPWVSLRSAPGYPDLTLAKAGEPLLFCELKTDTGTLTAAQADWIALLRQVQGCEVYVWTPEQWPAIEARLLRGRQARP
jgi:hypothetical protein